MDEELNRETGGVDVFGIDEIGKMECFSEPIVTSMRDLMDGDIRSWPLSP